MNATGLDGIINVNLQWEKRVLTMITAVITGASSGLGRELALGIKKVFPEIEELWLVARRRDRLEELAAGLDVRCEIIAADITAGDGMAELSRRIAEKKPEIRLLVNNAGCGTLGNFDGMEISGQLNMVDLNIRALTAVTRVALDFMPEGGNIINISSIASFVPNARMAVYCASKSYVRAFSRALGMELRGRKIAVTAICPGPMSTEFLDVAGINGNSKTFEKLPRVPAAKVAMGALRAARKRRPVYTPGLFYKFYRVLSAVVPDTIMMWFTRT